MSDEMPDDVRTLAVYLHLARASELRRQWLVRDKLLVLCASRAQSLGYVESGEHCRARLLAHNSGHMIGRFATVAEACADAGFVSLCHALERQFPREKAEHMLHSLAIELGQAEDTYASSEEYLSSILGPAPLTVAPRDVAGRKLTDVPCEAEEQRVWGDDSLPLVAPALSLSEQLARERAQWRALLTALAITTIAAAFWWRVMLR